MTQTQQQTAAIQKHNPQNQVALVQGVELNSLDQAITLAGMFAKSQLVPNPLKGKPEDVLLVMLKGLELGLKPVQALSEIFIVNGRPGASAKLKMALCLNRPDICEYFTLTESTDTKATYTTKRAGAKGPVSLTYTIEQAKQAGLTGKDTWKAHPAALLRARSSSGLADAVYPDLVQGTASLDELDEISEREVNGPVMRVTGVPETSAPAVPPEPVDDGFDWSAQQKPVEQEKQPEQQPNGPDPVEALLKRIAEAQNGKDLEALVPDIKALTKEQQLQVRKPYAARRATLNAAAETETK